HRGPGRAAHGEDQRADRAPAHAPEGPSLAPRATHARRQAPPAAALPPELGHRALPVSDPGARAAAMIEAGSPAPEFTLRDQDGNSVSLAGYRGRTVVLVFYPGGLSR